MGGRAGRVASRAPAGDAVIRRLRTLDGYVVGSWLRIFVVTAIGFPVVSILINLTDNLRKLLDRGLSVGEILISYVYSLPENIFLVMPAAVLFASVFTVGTMGRHSEITAAKAGGISFHRLSLPIFVCAALATALAVVIGEVAPGATAKQLKIQKGDDVRPTSVRYDFVYRADQGWVYTVRALDTGTRRLQDVVFERQGSGIDYPALVIAADSASYIDSLESWRIWNGTSRMVVDGDKNAAFTYTSMRLRALTQSPNDLLAQPKHPEEMRYAELGRYIDALRRSGNDVNKLMVEQALKFALPATCLVIALFGTPLAITSARSGMAFGIAVSLATTVVYLLMIQISEAVGAGGLMHPVAAAWFPNGVFLLAGFVLLWRART